MIARSKTGKSAIPAGSTYKLRRTPFSCHGAPHFPVLHHDGTQSSDRKVKDGHGRGGHPRHARVYPQPGALKAHAAMKPDGEEESPLLKTDAAFVRILIRLPRRHAALLQTPGEIPPSMSNLRYSIAAGSEGAFHIHLPCGLEISLSVLPGLSGFPASWPNPFPQRSKGDFYLFHVPFGADKGGSPLFPATRQWEK